MGLWSIYFFGKLYLYFSGYIHFEFVLNLLFACLLCVPLSEKLPVRRFLKGLRLSLALVFAFLLFWNETWFPPILRTVRLLSETGGITPGYIVSFMKDSFSIIGAGILSLIIAFCIILNKRIIIAPLVIAGILSVPLLAPKSDTSDISSYLDKFYQVEEKRVIHFPKVNSKSPDFDIIILNICSLSWDDLRMVSLEKDSFFRQFDLMFTNFNTVSSYTTPSIIRLLRASCGQTRHKELYRETRDECYVLESLRLNGYKTYTAIDNDAPPSYHWVEDIMTYGRADKPIEFIDLPIGQYDFDGSPIYDDLAILNRWWDRRLHTPSKKAALYMDITTLHGGSHWVNDAQWWKRERPSMYSESLKRLFSNLDIFFKTLSSSGRNFVIILVPEHGMALRGSSFQPKDIREIPLSSITTVPVGIKFIGRGFLPLPERQVIVSKPTSYLALAHLLSSFQGAPAFDRNSMLTEKITNEIPQTNFVAENEATQVVRKDNTLYFYGKENKWAALPPSEH